MLGRVCVLCSEGGSIFMWQCQLPVPQCSFIAWPPAFAPDRHTFCFQDSKSVSVFSDDTSTANPMSAAFT